MVTTRQKHSRFMKNRRESEHNLMEINSSQKKATRVEERNKETTKQPENKWDGISKSLPIITLNMNGLNSPIKRHRMTGWIKKPTQLYAAYKRLISLKTHKFKVKKWKTILHADGNQERAGVAVFILISDKIDIKPKAVTRDNH